MARTLGSVGLIRQEFESGFWEFCEAQDFNPGYHCARMLKFAAQTNDVTRFVQLAAIAAKMLSEKPAETLQQGDLQLVVDRRRESSAA